MTLNTLPFNVTIFLDLPIRVGSRRSVPGHEYHLVPIVTNENSLNTVVPLSLAFAGYQPARNGLRLPAAYHRRYDNLFRTALRPRSGTSASRSALPHLDLPIDIMILLLHACFWTLRSGVEYRKSPLLTKLMVFFTHTLQRYSASQLHNVLRDCIFLNGSDALGIDDSDTPLLVELFTCFYY